MQITLDSSILEAIGGAVPSADEVSRLQGVLDAAQENYDAADKRVKDAETRLKKLRRERKAAEGARDHAARELVTAVRAAGGTVVAQERAEKDAEKAVETPGPTAAGIQNPKPVPAADSSPVKPGSDAQTDAPGAV